MEKELKIGFGVLLPTISQQLKKQNFKFDKEKAKHFEKLRFSINYLVFSDLLNDKERDNITKKLFSKIKTHVILMNKS